MIALIGQDASLKVVFSQRESDGKKEGEEEGAEARVRLRFYLAV